MKLVKEGCQGSKEGHNVVKEGMVLRTAVKKGRKVYTLLRKEGR
jgi:hypothetical protein